MITIILLITTFFLINGIPYVAICLGRSPWDRGGYSKTATTTP